MTDDPEPDDRSNGSRIAVIGKAVATLDALAASGRGLTPTEVAEATGTNRSTTFRLLTSLEQAGLLSRDDATGRYRLGMKMLRYGSAVRLGLSVVQTAEPVLLTLRDETRQTTLLAIREDWGARCLTRLPGLEVDVPAWTSGLWVPLHTGAASRALLSTLDDAELDRYPVEGVVTGTLRDDLAEIRRRGWAIDTGAVPPGVSAMGAVVRDAGGTPVCAVSVAGLEHHYTGERRERTAAAVVAAAREIGARLPR